jgi:predicted lipoprotein with Yx(FWY)xxD motif
MRQWLTSRSPYSKPRAARLRWLGIVCVGAVALGAYGLVGTPAFAASKTSSAPKVTVKTKKVSGVGTVFVDAKGRTLYTLTNAGQAVACTGSCVAIWPPLLVPAGSTPKGAKGVTGLGLVPGGQQVTAAGMPLYRFSRDSKVGQASGEGISSFGGVWHVVKVAGTASSTGGSKPSSGGSGGYGY